MKPVQWFPGHMNKTRRLIKEQLGRMDVVIEILDARIPFCSRNPMIPELTEGKKRLIVFNKADLADRSVLAHWKSYYENDHNCRAITISSTEKKGLSDIARICREFCKNERWTERRAARALIAGIPNVGKSTLINALAGGKKAAVGNKPGVTRDFQRIKINKHLELIDTPGVLWPKFEDQEVGIRLAVLGSIKDSILDIASVTIHGLEIIAERYPSLIRNRFKLTGDFPEDPYALLEILGRKRGCLVKGALVDTEKAAHLFLSELRQGILGLITLDRPNESFMLPKVNTENDQASTSI